MTIMVESEQPQRSPSDSRASTDDWHRRSSTNTMLDLESAPDGLKGLDAATRLEDHGRNELIDKGAKRPVAILWEQITAIMVVILIAASVLSLLLGKLLEAGAIGAIVVLFVLLGFFQEYRAEKAIAALKRLSVPSVRVMRDGRVTDVAAPELVPGDVVLLEAGSIVPADLRLIEVANLRIEEAALTGESEPVDKTIEVIDRDDVALGDRRNMAYSGTQVSYGRGQGVVVATGMKTELGKIASLLQDVHSDQTPLQARLDRVGKQLALLGLGVALAVVAIGAAAGESASDLVLTAISVAVAVIPEGLPAVVTVTLAIGSQRMLRRNALIRKLPAVETLGSVTIICSDKTGTLTQNHMTATVVEAAGERCELRGGQQPNDAARAALIAGLLCNDASTHLDDRGGFVTVGDPTETALVEAARHAGIDVIAIRAAVPRTAERPFDSERKRMATIHPRSAVDLIPEVSDLAIDPYVSFVKGAVDGLIPRATHVLTAAGVAQFTEAWKAQISTANNELAAQGMRVLGIACRGLSDLANVDVAEDDLTLLGLVGIIDPPRREAADAVALCRQAGIRAVMITGDHPLTAVAIAKQIGISTDNAVLTGAQLDYLNDEEMSEAVDTVSVYARVSPEHKLQLVRALREKGHVVAMTGDGVNDAPALKQADIGVAMGITGTDVSKEASDMVLRDDNFASIVAAVKEGRVIYDNLRRFVKFAVAGNIGKIIVMLAWPIPFLVSGNVDEAVALLPLQLLWLNLMTDGLLGLSMGVERAEEGVMRRPPHAPTASIWADGLGRQAAWVGAVIGVTALGIGYAYYQTDQPEWQTMTFTSLAFLQVFQALGSRSSTESLRRTGLRSNPTMLWLAGAVVTLQMVALYTPLNDFLDVEPLGVGDLSICVSAGALLLALLEADKALKRRSLERQAVDVRSR